MPEAFANTLKSNTPCADCKRPAAISRSISAASSGGYRLVTDCVTSDSNSGGTVEDSVVCSGIDNSSSAWALARILTQAIKIKIKRRIWGNFFFGVTSVVAPHRPGAHPRLVSQRVWPLVRRETCPAKLVECSRDAPALPHRKNCTRGIIVKALSLVYFLAREPAGNRSSDATLRTIGVLCGAVSSHWHAHLAEASVS